jgi:hypothetical protein
MKNFRRRKLLPKPPEPPPGYMWFYWSLVPIKQAEALARRAMRGFDKLPRKTRDRINGDRVRRGK